LAHPDRYQFKLISENPENEDAPCLCSRFVDGAWQQFTLNNQTKGYLIFIYAILKCQHFSILVNLLYNKIDIIKLTTDFNIEISKDWKLVTGTIEFDVKTNTNKVLQPGSISSMLKLASGCPVSRNVLHHQIIHASIQFHN